MRVAALTNLASATTSYEPTSSNDAIMVRNTAAGLMDAEMTRLALGMRMTITSRCGHSEPP